MTVLARAAALLVALLVLGACGAGNPATPSPTAEPPGVALLSPDAFAASTARPERVTVNVHVPFEGTIPDTDLAVPYTEVADAVARGALPTDRATPIAVYCRSGPMSAEAAATLSRLGYRNVLDLAGGIRAWSASGRTILPIPAPTP